MEVFGQLFGFAILKKMKLLFEEVRDVSENEVLQRGLHRLSHILSNFYKNNSSLVSISFQADFCNLFPMERNKIIPNDSLLGLINLARLANK